MNAMLAIHPYKHEGMWVFDDPKVGLVQEPFVAGADTIIDRLVVGLNHPEQGFTLLFSSNPFPGHHATLDWRRAEMDGNWYFCREVQVEGWLCPALFKYFASAPQTIYAQFMNKKA